ncbi:MAG: hypothetical protein ACE5F1_10715 [Planctomycetota bacterium]
MASWRRSGRRYRQTPRGRRNGMARQRAYRARLKARVTHQGSACGLDRESHGPPKAAMVAASTTTTQEFADAFRLDHADPQASSRPDGDEPSCHFCGRPCGRFTRHDFLRPLARSFRRRHLARDAPS